MINTLLANLLGIIIGLVIGWSLPQPAWVLLVIELGYAAAVCLIIFVCAVLMDHVP
jgi:hypothetical protein